MLMNHVNLAKLVQAEPIKKHGENNFCVVLLAHAETQDEANKKEIELIEILQTRGITSNKRLQTRDRSKGYNIAIGGVTNVMTDLQQSNETRLKISKAHKGKKLTEQHRTKISQTQQGNQKRLGKMHTEETKKKIREALAGKKLSPETCEKISQGMLGREVSPETRAKIGAANRGKIRTEEMRQKNRESHLGIKQSPEVIEKRIASLRGRQRPEEVRRKISESNSGKEGLKGESNGSAKLTEEQVRKIKMLLASGVKVDDITKQFRMSRGAIGNIKSGRSWSHVILTEEESIAL